MKEIKKIKKAKIIMPIKSVAIQSFLSLISYNKEFIALEQRKGSNLATTMPNLKQNSFCLNLSNKQKVLLIGIQHRSVQELFYQQLSRMPKSVSLKPVFVTFQKQSTISYPLTQ
ncbi:unnamed protein product (macronuclear) [Paramecium tetraurelia]|uniref:Uncharacterized protein n=1 Tax=Paramecium tetraurelia TaxID=5888 RepID=A0CH02_PARTE|nr:uncharacterized protein GSPATT00007509001 [Paramecium tetraurelia]CAK70069.1 unnamed protein product [Paramecium tetraurelia]|eukprot:XP_001437466.1 hypothetical protein (macronuclear) [Paramecium tetraurelia strain d4-2]